MARQPNLRRKNGHWYSEAGGKGRTFGRIEEVSHAEAMARLWKSLAMGEGKGEDKKEEGEGDRSPSPSELVSSLVNLPSPKRQRKESPTAPSLIPPPPILSNQTIKQPPSPTVAELRDRYLDWLLRHRSATLHREAKRHLQRFCESQGEVLATSIAGTHLEKFQDALIAQGHALMYVRKHSVSVRACYNKGVKMGWLPLGYAPFANVEGIRIDPKPLLESDLPTPEEVKALLEEAKAKPMLHDMVAIYHATGMRTHELIEARACDFQPNSRTIVLGKHKRSRTLREPIPRTITLNATAYAILKRRCEGQSPDALIFPNRNGNAFTSVLLDDMFSRLRKRACVRSGITPYSLRHLWISEALAAGVDILLVARMAGTSVKMVESTYGHFKTSSYRDAQAKLDAMRKNPAVSL